MRHSGNMVKPGGKLRFEDPCSQCAGSGRVERIKNGRMQTKTCPRCDGEGNTLPAERPKVTPPLVRLREIVKTLRECGQEPTRAAVSTQFRVETGRPPFPTDLEKVLPDPPLTHVDMSPTALQMLKDEAVRRRGRMARSVRR